MHFVEVAKEEEEMKNLPEGETKNPREHCTKELFLGSRISACSQGTVHIDR